MKRYITFFLSILLVAVSCREESRETGLTDTPIRFTGAQIASKGFLGSGDLDVNGSQVKVFDILTGFDGTLNGTNYTSTDYILYIDDAVTYDGSAYWPYVTVGTEYRWTRTGVHRFFGYLEYDKSYNEGAGLTTSSFFGSNPSLNTDSTSDSFLTLTTPTHSFQALSTEPQYDFVVSKNAVVRNASSKDYSNVELPMKHLFTAVSLSFENNSTGSSVQITDISTIYQGADLFLHKGYATVDYSSASNNISPAYHLEGDTSKPFFSAAAMSGISIAPGEKYDILTGTNLTSGGSATFFMTWPLTIDQISPMTVVDYDIFGDPIYAESDAILAITYRANGGAPETARIKFPRREWKAGTRVDLVINFTDKSIQMIGEVLPWDYNIHNMDFNGESIVVPDGGKVSIDDGELHSDNEVVHLTTERPEVLCKLFISSLKGATLVINKIGPDPTFFEVEPSSLTITGETMHFTVKPSEYSTGGVERTIKLTYSIALPDGREIDADSEIKGNDHDYTFSRQ